MINLSRKGMRKRQRDMAYITDKQIVTISLPPSSEFEVIFLQTVRIKQLSHIRCWPNFKHQVITIS